MPNIQIINDSQNGLSIFFIITYYSKLIDFYIQSKDKLKIWKY